MKKYFILCLIVLVVVGCGLLKKPDGTTVKKDDPNVKKVKKPDGTTGHVYEEPDGSKTPLEPAPPEDQAETVLTALLPAAASNPYTHSAVVAGLVAIGAYRKVKPSLMALKEIYHTVETEMKGEEQEVVKTKLSKNMSTKSKAVIRKLRSKATVADAKKKAA